MSIYEYKIKARNGDEISMEDYRGKVLVIVNTATGCGFTPQYKELQELYELYHKDGLEILDFPCNQFHEQAPGSDEEIHSFCTLNYGTSFPRFSKIDVNGENAAPLYKYLTENTVFEGFGDGASAAVMNELAEAMDKDFRNNGRIKWNFTKFVIDRGGNIAWRFEPTGDMEDLKKRVEELL